MSTDLPQEDNDQPVETPAADVPAIDQPEAAQSTDSADSAEPVAEEVNPATESSSDAESVPQLTLGGASEEGEETAEGDAVEPAEYVQPTIRGRVDKFGTAIGTGRRKTAVARVRIKEGSGKFTINGREFDEFFCLERDRNMVVAPLKATEMEGKVDVWVRVQGGGLTGQTGAVVLGIARALQAKDETLHHTLAEGGFLTRDDRMVERKKYGLRKARRSFQFSKR